MLETAWDSKEMSFRRCFYSENFVVCGDVYVPVCRNVDEEKELRKKGMGVEQRACLPGLSDMYIFDAICF